ncbi:hypothetical protein [Pseudomonas sivasensis]|uniref:hypothetical protein n=1 Tax=Pseudomonas sivasensis TaxID=1880678 RepID=UPI003BA1F060
MTFSLPPFTSVPVDTCKPKDDWPAYFVGLAEQLGRLPKLPNFAEDEGVFVFSDYGGEHKGAGFRTYTYLIVSADKISVFKRESEAIRLKYGLGTREISFKDLSYGPARRALPDYLSVVNGCLHGMLLTVGVDVNIHTLFGESKKEGRINLERVRDKIGKGDWSYKRLEKMYRVYGPLVIMLHMLCSEGHKVLWHADSDTINEDGKGSTFKDAQYHLQVMLAEFSGKNFKLLGVAKSFDEHSYFDDLLSVADLAAGMMQDLLRHQYHDANVEVNEPKALLCKWLGTESQFLQKVNLAVVLRGAQVYFEFVDIDAIDKEV